MLILEKKNEFPKIREHPLKSTLIITKKAHLSPPSCMGTKIPNLTIMLIVLIP